MIRHVEAHVKCVPRALTLQRSAEYERVGRLGRYQLANHDWSIDVYNFYGYTNGADKPSQAAQTNEIIETILEERKARKGGPAIMMGDLNAEPKHIAALQEALDSGEWHDVATLPIQGELRKPDWTCKGLTR